MKTARCPGILADVGEVVHEMLQPLIWMRWPHEAHEGAAGDEASRLQLEVDENQTLMGLGFSADAMQSMIDDAEVDGCQWRLKQMRMTMNIWHCIVNALQDDTPCSDELLIVDVVEHRKKTDGVCLMGQIPRVLDLSTDVCFMYSMMVRRS